MLLEHRKAQYESQEEDHELSEVREGEGVRELWVRVSPTAQVCQQPWLCFLCISAGVH